MVVNIIKLEERDDRILNIVKAKYGFKNKSEAIAFLAKVYEENFLEPELRPEYIKKLNKIIKGKHGKIFNSVEELRNYIESKNV